MDIKPSNQLLNETPVENLIQYLTLKGWHEVPSRNKRALVFGGEYDIKGNPLKIVLPKNFQARDLPVHMASAVNLLAAIAHEAPQETLKRIRYYNADVLYIRNLHTRTNASISLSMATRQLVSLHHLMAEAAYLEYKRLSPQHASTDAVTDTVAHFQFGHTFPGSFGYTIEAPLINEGEPATNGITYPIPLRSIVERIMYGLHITEQATQDENVQVLVNSHSRGFNAKMCRAIAEMGYDDTPIEYCVDWSPGLPSQLQDITRPIRLDGTSYRLLAEAAEQSSQSFKQGGSTLLGR